MSTKTDHKRQELKQFQIEYSQTQLTKAGPVRTFLLDVLDKQIVQITAELKIHDVMEADRKSVV